MPVPGKIWLALALAGLAAGLLPASAHLDHLSIAHRPAAIQGPWQLKLRVGFRH